MEMASHQTVAGLVAHGIAALPEASQPPSDVINRMLYVTARNRACHALLNTTLESITSLLRREGIRHVLLKGQGLAALYRHEASRTCGDIDLWVGYEAYPEACNKARRWNSGGKCLAGRKHFHFTYGGVPVELHCITERMPCGLHNRKFRQWTEHMLREGNCSYVSINGHNYEVPPDDYNVVYVFNHFFHHFMLGGVSLRQLCDWALLLDAAGGNIDRQALERHLRTFGLWRAWHLFGRIAVEQLGLPASKMPFYSPAGGGTRKALSFILDSGNFGWYRSDIGPRPDSYWGGKWHSLRGNMLHFGKFFTLFPAVTAAYAVTFLYLGLTAIIKRK